MKYQLGWFTLDYQFTSTGLFSSESSSALFSEGSTENLDYSERFGLFICSSVPAWCFFSSGAAAVLGDYMRTVGAYQSEHRVLSDEDHVLLCVCAEPSQGQRLRIWRLLLPAAFTNGEKGRKSTVILR